MYQKILTIVLSFLVILFAASTTYFAITNSNLQKEASALSENNQKLEKEAAELKSKNENLAALKSMSPAPNQMAAEGSEEAKKKAKIDSIKSSMSAAVPSALVCQAMKTLASGIGGSKVCDGQGFTWPAIEHCGANPSDSKWVVKSGNASNWDFVLDCKEFTDCNGPQNAICNSSGCKFSGSCQ
jgi:hypothetical protein